MTQLSNELKERTREGHKGLEKSDFGKALSGAVLPFETYVLYLRSLAIIQTTLDGLMAGPIAKTPFKGLWEERFSLSPMLLADVDYFTQLLIPDHHEATFFSLDVCSKIRRYSGEAPGKLCGMLYVFVGSTNGMRLMVDKLEKALNLREEGALYFNNFGEHQKEYWADFSKRIDALELNSEQREEMISGAIEIFSDLRKLFDLLHPMHPDAKREYLVTGLNPEAGNHPFPNDRDLVELVLRATDRVCRRMPYFYFRYGQRGRNFTHSDHGWLLALRNLPKEKLKEQVDWLVSLLAVRGVPSITMEETILCLYQEAKTRKSAIVPEMEDLLSCREWLKQKRCAILSEERFDRMAVQINENLNKDWSMRIGGIGELMLSSYVDEKLGIKGAQKALQGWLTSSKNFPEWLVEHFERSYREIEEMNYFKN